MPQVFVYGSLKSSNRANRSFNRGLLMREGAEFVEERTLDMPLRMVNLGHFPALVPVTGGVHSITGEVYTISTQLLQTLDHIEGHPDRFYQRRQYPELLGEAWVYVLPTTETHYPPVTNGVW